VSVIEHFLLSFTKEKSTIAAATGVRPGLGFDGSIPLNGVEFDGKFGLETATT